MTKLQQYKLLAITAWAVVVGSMFLTPVAAQTSSSESPLYISNVAGQIGTQVTLTVCLDNADYVVRGVEFDVTLPSSVTFAPDSEDASLYAYATTSRSSFLNVVHYTPAGSSANVSKVMLYPKPSRPRTIEAGSGAILQLPICIPSTLADGFYQVKISNIVISLSDGGYSRYSSATSQFTLSRYAIGDADTNGRVEAKDARVVGQYILGLSPSPISLPAADADASGSLSIGDVAAIVDILK